MPPTMNSHSLSSPFNQPGTNSSLPTAATSSPPKMVPTLTSSAWFPTPTALSHWWSQRRSDWSPRRPMSAASTVISGTVWPLWWRRWLLVLLLLLLLLTVAAAAAAAVAVRVMCLA